MASTLSILASTLNQTLCLYSFETCKIEFVIVKHNRPFWDGVENEDDLRARFLPHKEILVWS